MRVFVDYRAAIVVSNDRCDLFSKVQMELNRMMKVKYKMGLVFYLATPTSNLPPILR